MKSLSILIFFPWSHINKCSFHVRIRRTPRIWVSFNCLWRVHQRSTDWCFSDSVALRLWNLVDTSPFNLNLLLHWQTRKIGGGDYREMLLQVEHPVEKICITRDTVSMNNFKEEIFILPYEKKEKANREQTTTIHFWFLTCIFRHICAMVHRWKRRTDGAFGNLFECSIY